VIQIAFQAPRTAGSAASGRGSAGRDHRRYQQAEEGRDRGALVERAGSGALRVIVDTTFPLTETAEAHEVGMAGHASGELVLIP
jgi:NADPH:quinone reductase-like Zn-dependent oxidoreductase